MSFTQSAGDVAAVYELARAALGDREIVLDVVPLFETGEDLTTNRGPDLIGQRVTSLRPNILGWRPFGD